MPIYIGYCTFRIGVFPTLTVDTTTIEYSRQVGSIDRIKKKGRVEGPAGLKRSFFPVGVE